MKKLPLLITGLFFCNMLFSFQQSSGQLLKRIKDEVKSRAEKQAINTSGNATDAVINGVKKDAREVITGRPADSPVPGSQESAATAGGTADGAVATAGPAAPDYKSYDFVAGDKIIFQPDLSGEPDAELPARFSIQDGNAEIQSFGGEKILHLDKGGYATVTPLMNSDKYLPGQFTAEFDMMYENEASYFQYVNDFTVEFRTAEDKNYHNHPLYRFNIENNTRGNWGGEKPVKQAFPDALQKSMTTNNTWHHIALYIRGNIGKVYIDQYRVAASNIIPTGANYLDIRTDGRYGIKIKNFRLAAGGEDKYNKIVTDGRFVTHGILFDVNKSGIQPASMGTLNEIARLMKEHADLTFEIDGHTDSDGDPEANLKLSRERAAAVKAQLVSMGIDGSRLSTKGYGSTQPIDKNDTAEGKANNRRVEFVKM